MNSIVFLSKKEKLKKKIRELVTSSSCHGLPNVFRTERKPLKFAWLFMFIFSSSYGFLTIYDCITEYFEYKVTSIIDVINESPTYFPVITFINPDNLAPKLYLNDSFIQCSFNSAACSINDFEMIKDKYGFISYRFKGKKSLASGYQSGLNIKLNNTSITKGLRITVHNESIDPNFYAGNLRYEAINAATGFETHLVVKRIFSLKLGNPYSQCLKDVSSLDSFDSELFKYTLNSTNYSYRNKECLSFCMAQLIINVAKFKLNLTIALDNMYNVNYYVYKYYPNEYKSFLAYFDALNKTEMTTECKRKCPMECDSIEYQVTTSFLKLDVSEQNLIAISIYYNRLEFTQISEIAKIQVFDVISNVGGLLGVFIGFSFLSFGEIIEIIVEILIIIFE